MNDLKTFENEEFGTIRTITIDDEPWFVGKDVAEVLGYSNTKDAIATHIDTEDRTVIQRSENATFEIPNRGMTIINESGLYSLVLSSKLPTAKKFKRWVTSEVLPSLRKTCSYPMGKKSPAEMLLAQAQYMVDLERKQQEMQQDIDNVSQRLDGIRDVVALNALSWREDAKKLIVRIAQAWGGNGYIAQVNQEIYSELNLRMGVNLKQRRTNKRRKMAEEGASKTRQDKVTYVDVIADDKKLIEGYLAIVKEMAIKYGVAEEGGVEEYDADRK